MGQHALFNLGLSGPSAPAITTDEMVPQGQYKGVGDPNGLNIPARIGQRFMDTVTGDLWLKRTNDLMPSGWVNRTAELLAGAAAVTKNTIALAQAMTRAQMAAANVVIVLGLNAAYDMEGGGVYHFDPAGTDADDSASVLRPSDYSGPGILRKII